MNKSYTILAVKGMTADEVSNAFCLDPSPDSNTLGGITCGDDSIASVFALGAKEGTTLALIPGLREESQEFYSLLGEGRKIGLFISDFETASATVSIFEDFNLKSKWTVSGAKLLEDSEGRFGNASAASEDAYYFHDLDLAPWNDLYEFIGTSPDDAPMSYAKPREKNQPNKAAHRTG